MLARRLSRQGVALSGAALATVLAHGSVSASVPAALIPAALQAAAQPAAAGAASAALAESVVLGLSGMKRKIATLLLVAGSVLGGSAWIACHDAGEARPHETVRAIPLDAPRREVVEKPDRDMQQLQGRWVAVSGEVAGVKVSGKAVGDTGFVFSGNRVIYWARLRAMKGTFRLDPTRTPRAIDIEFDDGNRMQGIYELDGGRLRLCWCKLGDRPSGFEAPPGDVFTILFDYQKKPSTSKRRDAK
jgi:uncharacterized protein (TIGR03067 family)